MCAGVGKSGSPAPKPITGSPTAFIALARASTARVADSWIAAMCREMRGMPACSHAPPALPGRLRRMITDGGARLPTLSPGMSRRAAHLLAVILAAFVTFAGVAPRADAAPQSPAPKAYIVVDADTGRVVASSNDHQALPPAST